MPIWVYGRDQQTGNPRDPLFFETESEADARKEAAAQGMVIESVEVVSPTKRLEGSAEEIRAERDRRGSRQYEFDADQNLVIATLAFYMRIIAVVVLVTAALLIVATFLTANEGSLARAGSYFVEGVIALVSGVLLMMAAFSFRKIVVTKGSDIAHLMSALVKLKTVFAIQVWLLALGLLVALIIFTLMPGR